MGRLTTKQPSCEHCKRWVRTNEPLFYPVGIEGRSINKSGSVCQKCIDRYKDNPYHWDMWELMDKDCGPSDAEPPCW